MGLRFRIADVADANGILSIYAPFCEATTVSFETIAPTLDQMRDRIRSIIESHPWIVVEADDGIAGYVYASRHRERAAYRWSVDVAVYIAGDHQCRGMGQTLYRALFAILREQGYFQAFAGISLPNPASVRLHQKLGFQQV